jgi:CubicO group peptidase (beta-lactamase class C family)
MTATVIAKLIEEGKLDWDTSLAKVFPREAKAWHPDWRGVTLHQLLTHTASMPAKVEFDKLPGKTTTDQRRAILAQDWLKAAPDPKPGTDHRYSNVGYALAGLVAETVTGTSWEDLMRQRLFKPLEMTRTGFGPPGTPGKVDQPWGHVLQKGEHIPSQSDNPACLGPAGTVHAPIGDWAKFVLQHVQSERTTNRNKLLLKPETFRKLHTPVKDNYACGWQQIPIPGKKEPYLFHSGSNTEWYAEMWLDPQKNLAVLVATNQGGDEARHAVMSTSVDLLLLANKSQDRP